MKRKLSKSASDKALSGVCGGIAEYFDISPFFVRALFFLTATVSIWVYIFLVWFLADGFSL